MVLENSWENASFKDITPKNVDIDSLPVNVRKSTKSPVVKKLREISFKTLKRFGNGNLIPELNKSPKVKE